MAIIGYIADTDTIDKTVLAKTRDLMLELGCDTIYEESTSLSTERPMLKYVLESTHDGDTLLFHKLSNALANTIELTNLCRLCMKQNVRIVSVQDKIDSLGVCFKPSHKDMFRLLSTFCQEAYASKHKMKKLKDIPDSARKIERQRQQEKKEVMIVDMYMSEFTYQEIRDKLNIKSNRTIMNVLQKHNVSLSRQKYKRNGISQSEDEE